ncbi:hypothetical protein SAMN05192540_0005 [Maribacter dokdonensis]|uniref:Uncharacterized protein n=2 Tax=Maribacter dokdonensis TaxID=320912 RepID=A0A1H4IZ79_9FLAO|nr:hypothetical protein SAMN05192540_0005 [Maribacter dokdonensis]
MPSKPIYHIYPVKNVGIELRVDAGVGYGRDHAVYLNPRIEERAIGPKANKWVIQPTLLTVNDRNEESRIKGRGDEPALVAIYFRSIFGRKGSTKLKIMDSILKLGNNIRAGITVAIPNEANLSVQDSGITANTEIDILGTSLVVMGCVFAAVELDNVGTEIVRSKIREKADKLKTALIEHIEGNPIPVPPPANFFTDILSQIDTDVNSSASGVSGGGFDLFGRLISNTGHDLIGTNQVVLIGASSDILRESFGDDYRPDSLTNPKAALEQGDFRIDFRGEDAHYSLDLIVRRSEEGILVR